MGSRPELWFLLSYLAKPNVKDLLDHGARSMPTPWYAAVITPGCFQFAPFLFFEFLPLNSRPRSHVWAGSGLFSDLSAIFVSYLIPPYVFLIFYHVTL